MDYLKEKDMYSKPYTRNNFRYNDHYRRSYYENFWYPYSIYDSQLSRNYQNINNFGYMYDVNQIINVNQIRNRYPYWY